MTRLSFKILFILLLVFTGAQAQKQTIIDDKYMENGVVSLADKKGFRFETRKGDFLFKPYLLVQTSGNFNYYHSEGIELADEDHVANSGFSIPNAILGFTGKAFGRVTFNLSINAAQSGGALLQQAWIDFAVRDALRFRVGKFKTPFSHAYLTTLGETLFPALPSSLTSTVILPHSLNAVNPSMATGFDLGAEVHGVINNRWGYEVGIFNGTGISVNTATKTTSDEYHISSLLYAARFSWTPKGQMPTTQGDPDNLDLDKMSFALSASYNVEAQNESSNDFRGGFEATWLKNRWYFALEGYWLNMKFTERQRISEAYNFWGAYAQVGYFITSKLQGALRYDWMDRNGTDNDGLINLPAAGVNYYFSRYNLKLQGMYQYLGRTGHNSQADRDSDNLGLAKHTAIVMLQYTF